MPYKIPVCGHIHLPNLYIDEYVELLQFCKVNNCILSGSKSVASFEPRQVHIGAYNQIYVYCTTRDNKKSKYYPLKHMGYDAQTIAKIRKNILADKGVGRRYYAMDTYYTRVYFNSEESLVLFKLRFDKPFITIQHCLYFSA